jgi:hypothetical protein
MPGTRRRTAILVPGLTRAFCATVFSGTSHLFSASAPWSLLHGQSCPECGLKGGCGAACVEPGRETEEELPRFVRLQREGAHPSEPVLRLQNARGSAPRRPTRSWPGRSGRASGPRRYWEPFRGEVRETNGPFARCITCGIWLSAEPTFTRYSRSASNEELVDRVRVYGQKLEVLCLERARSSLLHFRLLQGRAVARVSGGALLVAQTSRRPTVTRTSLERHPAHPAPPPALAECTCRNNGPPQRLVW